LEKSTNVRRQVTTNASGGYLLASVNPGLYDVSVTAPGFRTTLLTAVEMQVGRDLILEIDLSLGETSTTLEVTAEVPLLNSESGNLGHVMTNRQIVDLPLNGRGFSELARLTPGVVQLPGTGNVTRIRPEAVNGTTISGVRGRQVSFYLDGADTSEQHQGGSWIQTSVDALQEFSVQQNAYSSEHSRSGSFFNAITKSGTNALHGTAYEFLRNEKLDSRNFFARERAQLKRNQFGAGLGGPVRLPKIYDGRNKTFFFFNYEGMRERQGNVISRNSPSAAMLQGDFSSVRNVIYDPQTTAPNPSGTGTIRTPFPGNRIPSDRLSAQARFFNPFLTTAAAPGAPFVFSPSTAVDMDQTTSRIDHTINDNHRVFFRWSLNNNRLSEPGNSPALGVADSSTRGNNYTVSITSSLRPTIINEFRFNTLYGLISLNPFLLGRDFNKEAGITGLEDTRRSFDTGSFPDFNWSGYTGLAGSSFDQRPKTQDRYTREFVDNLTWIKGAHVFKFGTKIRYYSWLGTDSKQYMGLWNFNGQNTENPANPSGTGDSFADWMLGLPSSATRSFPSDTFGGDYTAWHFFVQDDIKVTRKLTLNLGLRYEYTPFTTAFRGQTGTFDGTQARPLIVASNTNEPDLDAQPAARTAYGYLRDLIQTSSQAGLPYSITRPDKKQWAPRFGFAWRPMDENTVIRGGYGIFYEGEYTDGRVNLFMPPFLLSETALNDRGVNPNRTLPNFFLGAPLGSRNSTVDLTPTYTNLDMGYDQHWNFGVQRQIARNMVIDVEYVGNKGTNIQGSNAFNIPDPGAGAVPGRRPYPRFGPFSYISSDTSSTYHALQAKLERRLSAGLWFLTSYTFSKSLWTSNTPAAGGRYRFERGPSEFQVPHTLAVSYGYELPFGRGKQLVSNANRFTNALLGGWQMQGILIFRSGVPFTPTVSRDVANTGVGGQRPNRIQSGELENPTLERWFDVSAFAVAPNFTYGNSGLRILYPDIVRTIDFSMFKNFQITEGSRLQFRWEVFNLPNTPSFAAPASVVDVPATAGRVTATSTDPRQMQVALKFTF
ncbi:MAG: carboxypeptidase regulatory-like domain-containing protein, partial [Bryobacteraceae bacterium]|nr:carboxypeptidase regulatory-like domain-containing protein [Bryobacteraceae bacterium]